MPDSVTTENAAFAELLAAAFRVVEQNLVPAKTIAIVGDGKLGLLIGEVLGRHAQRTGSPRPVLYGRHVSKMKLLSSESQCDTALSDTALPKNAYAYDVVVDATGSPAGLDLSRQAVPDRRDTGFEVDVRRGHGL